MSETMSEENSSELKKNTGGIKMKSSLKERCSFKGISEIIIGWTGEPSAGR